MKMIGPVNRNTLADDLGAADVTLSHLRWTHSSFVTAPFPPCNWEEKASLWEPGVRGVREVGGGLDGGSD